METSLQQQTIQSLRRYLRTSKSAHYCELCQNALAGEHRHLLEMTQRKPVCACDACGMRFQNVVGGRYKLIPRDVRKLTGLRWAEGLWESFALPINLAFFYRDSSAQRMKAVYPSPAGATESLLPLNAWTTLEQDNPDLTLLLQADVEALLVYRVKNARLYYQAPIDRCYQLAGLIRRSWQGFTGGEEAWQQIDAFFTGLDPNRENAHA